MIYDFINKKSHICHQFANPLRIRSLRHDPLQDICVFYTFKKLIEIIPIGDETGFVQVSTAAIAGGMIVPITSCVFVFQNKSITQVDFESIGLLFEHGLQWSFSSSRI